MGRLNINDVSVSSQLLFQVFRSCQELGARKPVLLSALNLTDAQIRDPRASFCAQTITTLYDATAQELGRNDIFEDIGRAMTPTGFSDICYAAMFEETVGSVLHAAAAAMLVGANKPVLRWEQSTSTCRLVADPDSNGANDLIFIIFSTLSHIGRIVTNDDVLPIETVSFTYRPSPNCDDSMALSEDHAAATPCHFNRPETYLELRKEVLSLPNPFANRDVVRMGQHQLNRFQIIGNDPVTLTNLSYNYLFLFIG